ncbi:FAD-dependent monooxygenase [Streptomyces sp. SS7]|uniref:FAD-dependent monooxygenase n=1 Tax=Streptomyces sp. SS7 TaxID=3108485 RepID=UPI0030EE9667
MYRRAGAPGRERCDRPLTVEVHTHTGAIVRTAHGAGRRRTVRARYVLACDGGSSTLRVRAGRPCATWSSTSRDSSSTLDHWTASDGRLDLEDLLDEAFGALSPGCRPPR